MTDRELMQMALDALENYTAGKLGGIWDAREAIDALRDRLAQPEPTGREIQKMMQSAWKAVRTEYKDDPECCFALGWEAGYGAVAPRVEPPETESGEGFESLPAPPPKQPEPEPVAFYGDQPLYAKRVHAIDTSEKRVHETDKHRHVAKNATSEWVGLTHDEAKVLVERFSSDPLFLLYQHESKLKEKNR